jgi:DNA-binding transcriptional regulator YiaG
VSPKSPAPPIFPHTRAADPKGWTNGDICVHSAEKELINMPNLNAALNDHIRRLARREIRAGTQIIKKAGAHHRRDIASLKRQLASLASGVAWLRKQSHKEILDLPGAAEARGLRFRADGMKTHRAKLGLSAEAYGKLVGVSPLTIYHWEARKSKPRKMHLPRLAAVRAMGKREAMQRLGYTDSHGETGAPPAKIRGRRGPRGKFKQTGEQSILSLLKGGRGLMTKQINAAWIKEGRGGTADVLLGLMVKARKLKRTKIAGQRGSEYRAA